MSPARPDVGASIRHNYYMALLARFRAGWGWSDAGARGRRYAADKLTELVSAALEAGADAGTLASLQVRRALPALLHAPARRLGDQSHTHHVPVAFKLVEMLRRKPSNVLICSAGNPQICSGHMTPKRLRNTLSARGPPCMSMLSCLGSRTRARQTMHPVDPTVCRRPFHKSARLRAPHGRRASRSATGAAAATRRCRRTRTPRSSRTSWRARAPRRRSPSAWTCCS